MKISQNIDYKPVNLLCIPIQQYNFRLMSFSKLIEYITHQGNFQEKKTHTNTTLSLFDSISFKSNLFHFINRSISNNQNGSFFIGFVFVIFSILKLGDFFVVSMMRLMLFNASICVYEACVYLILLTKIKGK